jgi:RNA polymerase sigma factor (sigma-70 family)
MTDVPDARLVEQFARNGSEEAFAALVQRHIALVHSVALRHTANTQHAQDITQAVFVILARKAGALGRKIVLPGWLYHTARLTAANLQRAETRRVRREQEAFMQSTLEESPTDALWRELSPQLDEAMAGLGANERDALVLRYFQNKSMVEVGKFLGLEENTAQKRVSRALEKLRIFFTKRGVSLTASGIADTISTHSVQAVPVALAKAVVAVALAKGVTASASTLTLIKGALKIMAWTKAKTAIVAGAVVILAAGTTTPIVVHVVHQRDAAASIFTSKTELTDADNAAYQSQTGTTPAQVAQAFFDACSQEDWATADKYWQTDPRNKNSVASFPDSFKQRYGGLQIVSVGKPFKARISIAALLALQPNLRNQLKGMGGQKDIAASSVFVPYEMRLKDGSIRKWQLSIRCDNPDHRWYYDGGM